MVWSKSVELSVKNININSHLLFHNSKKNSAKVTIIILVKIIMYSNDSDNDISIVIIIIVSLSMSLFVAVLMQGQLSGNE